MTAQRHGITRASALPVAWRKAATALAKASCLVSAGVEAVAVIANLTPFRGPSADAGTAFELGYMAGRGKFCLGYSNDGSIYVDRVRRAGEVRAGNGGLVDAHGLTVEDFALPDNLMLVHTLDLYKCPLVTPRLPPLDLWYDLAAFEACVRAAAERLYRARA